MQIFVSGTWKAAKARPFADQAMALGRAIAQEGFDLACGPGTGIARYAIDGFRAVPSDGLVRYYLPTEADMEAAGEEVLPGADVIEKTELDYPMRNVFQVSQSNGLFVLTGGDGTLEEILPAVIDYEIPVAIVNNAGSASEAVSALLPIYPGWSRNVRLGGSVNGLVEPFFADVRSTADSKARPFLQDD
jgi:uncharacterized protein (TIGR00725 family)